MGDAGNLKKYFTDIFDRFDSGRTIYSWNWFAAIFQLAWYLFKRMWPKMIFYVIAIWAVKRILWVTGFYYLETALWAALFAYFGLMANYDYYLYRVKGEYLWPRLPYKKIKVFFWTAVVVITVYGSVTALASIINEPEQLGPYADGAIRFDLAPNGWMVYKNPSLSFSMNVSRRLGDGVSESLVYPTFRGTKFLGYIGGLKQDQADCKGLVALIENRPLFGGFSSVDDKEAVKLAKMYAGQTSLPAWLGRWFSMKRSDAEYRDIAGRRWGVVRNVMEINVGSLRQEFCIDVYWTVAAGRAIYVVSEFFTPFKDDVERQVEDFLGSFKAG